VSDAQGKAGEILSAIHDKAGEIGAALDEGWDQLVSGADAISGIDAPVEEAMSAITGAISGAASSDLWNGFSELASSAATTVIGAWESAKSFFGGIWDWFTGVEEAPETFEQMGSAAETAASQVSGTGTSYAEAIGPMQQFAEVSPTMSEAMATASSDIASSAAEIQAAITDNFGSARSFAETEWPAIAQAAQTALSQCATSTASSLTMIVNLFTASFATINATVSSSMATMTSTVTSQSAAMLSAFSNMMSGIASATASGFASVVASAEAGMSQLYNTCMSWAQQTVSAIQSAFASMVITIPAPKLPVINVGTNTVAVGGSSVSVPTFSVSWNALGGIFEDPTIFNTPAGLQGVGEAGPEAILPLDTLWTQMRDILSDILSNQGGQDVADSLLSKLSSIGAGTGQGAAGDLAFAGGGGMTVTYAPVYNLNGSAGAADISQAAEMSQERFGQMMSQWQKQNKRRGF